VVKHLRARTIPNPRTVQVLERGTRTDPVTLAIKINLKVAQYNHHIDTILSAAAKAEQADLGGGSASATS